MEDPLITIDLHLFPAALSSCLRTLLRVLNASPKLLGFSVPHDLSFIYDV